MSTQSHLDNFGGSTILDSLPLSGFILDFSKIVVVDVLATSGSFGSPQTGMTNTGVGSNSSVVAKIAEGTDLTAAPYASGVGVAATAVLTKLFAAENLPREAWLLSIDEVGGDSWTNIWADFFNAYPDIYAVIVVSDAIADIADVAEGVAAQGDHMVFGGLNAIADAAAASATWDANDIGTLTAAQKQILWVSYHDKNPDANTDADFAEYAANILTADFDRQAPGGNMILKQTSKLGTLTATQKSNLDANNVNHALPLYTTETYVDKGVCQNGLGIYNTLTAHWWHNRSRNALAEVKLEATQRRVKIPVSSEGQTLGINALSAVVSRGIRAGHFLSPAEAAEQGLQTPYIRALSITTADRTAGILRFECLQYSVQDARELRFTNYLKI